MSDDPTMRLLQGAALRWTGEISVEEESEQVGYRDTLWLLAGIIIPVLLVVSILWGLNALQTSGEAPAFTCAPGTVYTVKECP